MIDITNPGTELKIMTASRGRAWATLAICALTFAVTLAGTGRAEAAAVRTDLNADHYADLLVPAPLAGSGEVRRYFGSPRGLRAGGRFRPPHSTGTATRFGSSVFAADLNHDGRQDVAIGEPRRPFGSADDAGQVTIFYAAAGGGWRWRAIRQPAPGKDELFGASLAAGDFNHDNRKDLAVGSPGETVSGEPNAGAVTIHYYGAPGGISDAAEVVVQAAPERNDLFGGELVAGYYDDDRARDLAVGAPGETVSGKKSAGVVTVHFGGSRGIGPVPKVLRPNRPRSFDYFGTALADGDFNRDRRHDLAVGADGDAHGSSLTGFVSVFRGTDTGLRSTPKILLQGPRRGQEGRPGAPPLPVGGLGLTGAAEPGDEFGDELAARDLDRDGRDDLVVGAPGQDFRGAANARAGAVTVHYGTRSGLSQGSKRDSRPVSEIIQHTYPAVYDHDRDRWNTSRADFGTALALGDYNGDGRTDLAVGVPFDADCSFCSDLLDGHVEIFHGGVRGRPLFGSDPSALLRPPLAGVRETGIGLQLG